MIALDNLDSVPADGTPVRMRTVVLVAASLIPVGGLVLVPIRLLGGGNEPESPFAAIAFALPFIVAGLLAVWCERRNRHLILFGLGVAVGLLSMVSIDHGGGGGSTSNIITWAETGISTAILATTVLIVVFSSSDSSQRHCKSTLGLG